MIWQDKTLELLLVVPTFVALMLFGLAPRWRGLFRRGWRRFAWITSRSAFRTLCGISVVVAVVGSIPPILGWTQPPWIHDEIANLLAADTFLHGRLTNPTPPFWESFQTNHELMQPSYASKFPPGQGLMLAAGTLLGSPRVGTIASLGLAAALTAWMCRAVMSWRWAAVCGLFAGFQPTIFMWSTNFWGGGVAMIGGALLAGCALRADAALRQRRAIHGSVGILAGIAMAVLANSRPFEGAITTVLLSMLVFAHAVRSSRVGVLLRPALLAIAVLLPVFGWMGYYNYRVTGHALRMPYAEHSRQYMSSPIFWWQHAPDPPPKISAAHVANFYRKFEPKEFEQLSGPNFFSGIAAKARDILVDAFRPMILALPLAIGLVVALRRSHAARLGLATILALIVIHFSCTPWFRTHYLAVVAPLFVMLIGITMRDACKLIRRRLRQAVRLPLEPVLNGTILIVMVLFALRMIQQISAPRNSLAHFRQKMVERIEEVPGKHLVLVYYARTPQHIYEWVYNGADLESQRVIFAHSIDNPRNTALSKHFADRSIWVILIADQDAQMRPILYRRKPGEAVVVDPPVKLPEPLESP